MANGFGGAAVGFAGLADIYGKLVRVTNASIQAAQEITTPDPVSNVPEQPMWHVGPVMVDGSVSFPLVSDIAMSTMFEKATLKRNGQLESADIKLIFPGTPLTPGEVRRFTECVTSRLTLSCTAGERIEVEMNVLGKSLADEAGGMDSPNTLDMTRVLTWDMVEIVGLEDMESCLTREFSLELDNDCSHNFTYQSLDEDKRYVGARSITTGRRAVTGKLGFLGVSPVQKRAVQNLVKTTANDSTLTISVVPGFVDHGGGEGRLLRAPGNVEPEEDGFSLIAKCNRVVYDWQDISLAPDTVISTATWRAHGDGPGAPAAELTFPAT
jgi:hypothetical protein